MTSNSTHRNACSKHFRAATAKERYKGSALLAVLWLSAALSAIAFTVASNVRGETERTATVVDSLRCYYLASGSIERALLYIQWGGKYYHAPMPVMRFSYPSGDTIVEIIPESARLSVNRATPADLQAVAQAVGATPDQASLIAQGIVAWRGAAVPGAPADQFTLPINPSFPARHASFEEIEELLLIRGITPELFYGRYVRDNQDRLRPVAGLKDCLSVYGGTGGFDVNTASPALLRALGLSPGAVEGIVARRKASPILSMDELAPFQDGSPGFGRLGLTPSPICTLRATARLRLASGALSDVERSVSAMIRFLPLDYNPPFHIMRWYDNAFSTE